MRALAALPTVMTTSGFGGRSDDGRTWRGWLRCRAGCLGIRASAVSLSGVVPTGSSIGSTFGTWMSTSAANATPGFNACSSAGVEWKRSASASSSDAYPSVSSFGFLHHVVGDGGERAGRVFRRDVVARQRIDRRNRAVRLRLERGERLSVFAPPWPSITPAKTRRDRA